jgi:DNA phosphorothioation-associated putative methyltransferase
MARALGDGLISPASFVFDYGCGRGGDLRRLRGLGVECDGYDVNHRASAIPRSADVVNLGYVVNVIEDVDERERTLRRAWSLAREVLVVAARLVSEARDLGGQRHGDGLLTSTGTFQKLYTQETLRAWLEGTLQRRSVAAAPGIFYVFREPEFEQAFLARRTRRSGIRPCVSRALFERHEPLLRWLMDFYSEHGRLPRVEEAPEYQAISAALGSPRAAFAVIRPLTGTEPWDRVRVARSEDLLVFLALARFGGRARPSELPRELRYDIRDLFGSYKAACEQADRLLFAIADSSRVSDACRAARVGKHLPTALYVHVDALGDLPPILRVLEGSARVLIGHVDEATLIKIHMDRPAVSYLEYPTFDTDPHPSLRSGYVIRLDSLRIDFRDYSDHRNPAILHRKETFLSLDDPRRKRFEVLTRQEIKAGLFSEPRLIGRRLGWEAALSKQKVAHHGHRLVRTT